MRLTEGRVRYLLYDSATKYLTACENNNDIEKN